MKPTTHTSAERVMRFHRATGMGIMASKQFLSTRPAELCECILRAAASQQDATRLHDPIADAPETAGIVAAAFARAQIETDAAFQPGYFRGRCHAVWQRVEHILGEAGIQWFSPVHLNPGSCFD